MTSFLTYRGPPPSTGPAIRIGPTQAEITHGSPFAASPFVPASGAPGFGGDRAWNKGFDDSNGSGLPEWRGVQLLGRNESTRVVLGTSLANTVRPCHFGLPLLLTTFLMSTSFVPTSLHVRGSPSRGRYFSA